MYKTELERNMMDAVFKAKLLIESRHIEENDLKWTYAATIDSKGIRTRAEMYVLKGKRPFGYIIASYSIKKVSVLDENFGHLITYEVKKEIL
jgi:hypothetical protein